MADPTAQMGLHMGKSAFDAGQQYLESNMNRWVNVASLKHYFNVSNSYVVSKLRLVLFPWWHRPWSRTQHLSHNGGQDFGVYAPPREDINSPDMYIPLMALVTYILFSTLLAGLRRTFHPELFGLTATTALVVVFLEIAIIRLAMYLLSINNESQLLDLVAYSGYKFVGVILTLLLSEIANRGGGSGGWVGWGVFIYTFAANGFFLLRSLKYVLLPDTSPNTNSGQAYTASRSHRQRRTQFLFIYSFPLQFLFMWILTRDSVPTAVLTGSK
ncbi:hypothetical protein BT63DRAFT_376966 [Microthyrium microscopicum]|uniref:Protein YIF1 n=1 Tax=Microthyrium microscopicum TaxID=703497 RepID=A0A6A6U3X8_9PEZI|nr:hypothetical protein BT63DRAFT_376966 [Microthyrium microscopicum]